MGPVFELISLLVVLISFWGVGTFVGKSLSLGNIERSILGSLVFAFFISIFGHFIPLHLLVYGFMALSAVFAASTIKKKDYTYERINLPFLPAVYLGLGFLLCFWPSTYFDPLNYHLFGIVKWVQLGKLTHFPSAIQIMHDSFGDYLFFPFAILFDLATTEGLLSLQVSSQLLSFTIGVFFFSCLLNGLLKNIIPGRWVGFVIFAILVRASLQHKAFIAKNDWIVLTWFLFGAKIYWNNYKVNLKQALVVSGFAFGLCIGTKLTYLPAVLILLAMIQAGDTKLSFRSFLLALTCILGGILPYLVRNYVWTSNPIFPLAHTFFPSEFLGPSWIEGFKFFDAGQGQAGWDFFWDKILRILTYDPLVYFFLAAPFFWRFYTSQAKVALSLIIGFLIVFILYFGPNTELRHFGPIALSLNLFSALSLMYLTQKFKLGEKTQLWTQILVVLSSIGNVLLLENQLHPLPSAMRSWNFYPRTKSLMDENKGLALFNKIYLTNLSQEKFAILDDTPPYYFSALNVIRIWDDPVLDRALKECRDIRCVVKTLKVQNISFLIDSGFDFDPYYQPGIKHSLLRAIKIYPDIVIIEINGERLISLDKLSDKLEKT